MLRMMGQGSRLCDGLSRRELLRVGGLGIAGLTLPGLLEARAAAPAAGSFGRAKSCILLYMSGGPPQHETWDPKPDGPAEIRGVYKPIPSSLDGLQVGELMPLLAKQAHRCAVIRSMATDINAHTGSGFMMLTGHPNRNQFGESLPPDPADWPNLGAMVKRLLPGEQSLPSVVTLPELIKNNPGIIVAGNNAGFMGAEHNPFLLECDPSAPDFQISGLSPLPEVPLARLNRRRGLLAHVNDAMDRALAGNTFRKDDAVFNQAFDLVTGEQARQAFDVRREPATVRERYGMHKFGQSCLLARRLIEAGTRLVTVNFPREPGDFSIGNPLWDTHADNNGRLKNNLMPPMDQGCSALLEDLHTRGLLDETLIVWMGEFGRSPRFNASGGRDHWGHVFSVMLAGGGIRPGVVYGESDFQGAFPQSDRVEAAQLHATIFHCLGIPPNAMISDIQGRPLPACDGEPIRALI